MEEGLDNVWEFYGFSGDDNPDEIIRKVDLNVLSLLEEHILKEEPTVLVQLGRKGTHLFTHYKSRIEEKGFLTCLYRLFLVSQLAQIRPAISIPSGKPVIIVADTIHTGSELSIFLSNFYSAGIEVKKIFCYLENEEGVQNLITAGLIDREKVVGLFSSYSEEEYMKESRQVQAFFRSRITPMDPDTCFNLYNVGKILRPNELKGILEPILKDVFRQDITVKQSYDRGLASNIKELHCSIDKCSKIDEVASRLFQEDFDHKIYCINIRSKLNQKRVDSDFAIIVKPETNCSVKKKGDPSGCLKAPENCLLTRTEYKKEKEFEVKKLVCPACVDLSLSDSVLNELHSILTKVFEEKGLELKLKWAYRPIEL